MMRKYRFDSATSSRRRVKGFVCITAAVSHSADLRRLYEGAKALDMEIGLEQDELQQRIEDTCAANSQVVCIRLMVTRGIKATPIDPLLPSHRRPFYSGVEAPLANTLEDSSVHCARARGYPDVGSKLTLKLTASPRAFRRPRQGR